MDVLTVLLITVLSVFVLAAATLLVFWVSRNRISLRLALGMEKPRCELCTHWDREAFVAAMRKHPAFVAASQWVTPNDHTRSAAAVEGEEAAPPPEERKRLPLSEDSWERIGACSKHEEGRHAIDHCAMFRLHPRASRREGVTHVR